MLDYLGVLKSLNDAGVKYLVAGGLAVNMYGIPRMTYDLDLLVQMEEDNLHKLLDLLNAWGFKPKIPVPITDLTNEEKRREWIAQKHMKAFNVFNEKWALSEIDILMDSPVGYGEAAGKKTIVRLGDVDVPLVSVDHLILMKQGTGRKQDEADIRHLEKIRDER